MKKSFLSILIMCIGLPLIGQTFGNAINLDGIDDYAVVPHDPSLNPSNGSWSVAFWIKAANKDQISPVVMKRLPEPPYTQYSYGFGKDDPHDPEPGKRIRVNHIEDAGVSERSGYATDEVINGLWHHFVVVADKQQDGIVIYYDGIPLEFVPLYYYGTWPDVTTTYDLIIGSGSSGSKIEGPLDEMSIWNKALNINQVQQMMYDTLSAQYYNSVDSGLVAYYRFDEYEDLGVGADGSDDIRDFSIHGNHADTEGLPELIPSGILTAIEEKTNLEAINIFPNPAKDKLILKSQLIIDENATLELYDLNGRKLLEQSIPKGQETSEINVSGLQSGVYFCRLSSDGRNVTKKLIIQK